MARQSNIKLRRSATQGSIPTTSNLDLGELAVNTSDGKLYMKTTEGSLDSVIQVGSATDTYFKIRKTVNQNFTVAVASKTTDHVYHGSGSSSGYVINGIESPHLNFVPGNSYQFDQSDSSNSGHPLRFYYDAAKTTAYTAGVTTSGTPGSSGAYTKIVPTKDTPMVLYYQCSAHGYMGGSVSFATRNLTGFDTDDLGEGSSNLYYTDARAQAISINNVVEDTTPQLGGNLASNGNDILFADNDKAVFGAGSDLQIYHNGSNSFIDNNTGDLVLKCDSDDIKILSEDDVVIGDNDDTTRFATFTNGGAAALYYNGSQKLATTSAGINVTGIVENDGLRVDSTDSIRPTGDNSLITISGGNATNSGANYSLFGGTHATLPNIHRWRIGGSEAARIDASGNFIVGKTSNSFSTAGFTVTSTGTIQPVVDGGSTANFNRLSSDGNIVDFRKDSSSVGAINAVSGDLAILSTASGHKGLRFGAGAITPTTNTAAIDNGNTDLGGNTIRFKDLYLSGDITLGDDLNFSTNGFADISNTGTGAIRFKPTSQTLALTLTGANADFAGNVVVGGNLTVQGTTTTVNSTTLDVVDKNLTLNYHASNDTSGNANGAGITIQDAVNASTDATILWDATNDEFDFSHPVNITGRVVATGISQFADVNIPDNNAIRFGNSQDLQIFHDGSNSIIKDNGDGHVQVLSGTFTVGNASLSKTSAVFNSGGSQDFYHNNNKKLETTNTGVKTTGTVNVNNAYTLPTSDGSSGQVLQTDGSGTLSFATVSSGGGGTVSEAFKNIAVSGQSNIVADAATDTLTFAAGSGIQLTTTPGTDTLTITSTATGSVTEAFKTIAVSGQSDIVADSATDTLTLAAGSNMTITQDASTDTITFASSGSGGASQSALYKEYVYTPGSSTTTFTGSDANGDTLSYTVGYLSVYLNGVLLKPTTDYAASNGSSIVLVNAAASGDVIQIATFVQIVGTGDSSLSELSGNGSTTAFTIAANPNHENNTQVYIDGIYQEKATYSISGTTLTFSAAPPSGSSIEVVIGSRNVTVDDVQGFTVNGDLTVDTNTLYVDSTNNKVGIGTTTPQESLHTTGNIRFGDSAPAELYTNSSELRLGVDRNNDNATSNITFLTNNDEKVRIDANGNVGIGTTSPGQPLHVEGNVRLADAASIQFGSSFYQTITGQSGSNDLLYRTYQDHVFKTGTGPSSNTDGTTRMVIDVNGKVGIGTASPGVSLDVGSLTDAIRVPNGTTGQRPTAALGQLRYNTTTSEFEGYAAGAWGKIGGGGDSFGTIAVSGQTNIVAEQENDTLTIVGAGGITATTTAGTDTLTLTGQTSINPYTQDFFTTADNSTTEFTLSVTPPSEDNLIVFVEGVYQNKNSYVLSGTTLTLDGAPVSGSEVVVHIIQNGVVGAGHIVDEFTGDGNTAAYTLSVTPLNENNTFVYLDGVYQEKSTYSVSGNTLTFDANVTSGHSIEIVTPQVSEINQPAAGSIDNVNMFSGLQASEITSTTLTTTSASTIATHAIATYRSVNYQVQVTQGTDYHMTTVNVIHDGTTAHFTEYGTVFDNAALGTFDATITSGNLLLQITPGSNASLTTKVVSTAIPV